MKHIDTQALLLRRQNLVFVSAEGDLTLPGKLKEQYVRGLELQLSSLGYLPSVRLRVALSHLSLEAIKRQQGWLFGQLSQALGANQKHTPLFRKFPEDVPEDTEALWVKRVLVHFFQGEGQPCLYCRKKGTTHVLRPCRHVVCDQCFDGSSYSGCPICGHKVDTTSPFFKPGEVTTLPNEKVSFKLLDLGEDVDTTAQLLFLSFCERKQALSPVDQEDLKALVRDYREEVLSWLPEKIPVKEVMATVFGTLCQVCPLEEIFPTARKYLSTATDVLRFIAAYSWADPSLQKRAGYKSLKRSDSTKRWWGNAATNIQTTFKNRQAVVAYAVYQTARFKVVPLSRPFRRALLSLLNDLNPDSLIEDMLRQRSLWVWVGEFLHPHEYAKRFPNVARGFQVVRRKAPDGTKAPLFQGFYSKLESAAKKRDARSMVALLQSRPGELARRFDYTMRLATGDQKAQHQVLSTFTKVVGALSTPVLLTLHSFLPTRIKRARVRIYWPKGQVSKGVSMSDKREPLSKEIISPSVSAIDAELLRRFSQKPPVDACIVDEALSQVIVPFNERTASPSAVSLPRGSRVSVPSGKVARLFLHWCEPEKGGETTDIDLSVGFYDASWKYVGVCSYYGLRYTNQKGAVIAQSSGDFTSAPFPDGASEFVDLHRENAKAQNIRFAVMVVNAYGGMPFSQLERAFAGLMLREDVGGHHFDPRTVTLKFSLQGENGIFMPLVFDLVEDTIHWLDVYSTGELAMNNVASSNKAITRICPEMIEYFGSGVRTSLFELALLHAAARGARVFLRGEDTRLFVRRPNETNEDFYGRLKQNLFDQKGATLPGEEEPSVFAALYQGDIPLYPTSARYVLFPEQVTGNLAASDLLSA